MAQHLLHGLRRHSLASTLSLLVVPVATLASFAPASASARHDATPRPAPEAGAPPGFSPESVTYVSSSDGFVLGTVACARTRCPELWRTTDDGASWSAMPAPPIGALRPGTPPLRIRFADPEDGWVYSTLPGQQVTEGWVTHSGGAHWSLITFPVKTAPSSPLGIEDIEAAGGVVDAAVQLADGVEIFSSPVDSDAWRRAGGPYVLGAGPVPYGELVLQGRAGWFVENDRVVVSGGRAEPSGPWASWRPPCTRAGGPVALAAPNATDVEAVCSEGIWSGTKIGVDLLSSHDGGTTFGPSYPVPVRMAELAAAASPSSVAVGATVLGRSSTAAVLEMTFDGGASWAPVYRHPGGDWLELGFTTATQGVAIVAGANGGTNTMLFTANGGRSWAPVAFH